MRKVWSRFARFVLNKIGGVTSEVRRDFVENKTCKDAQRYPSNAPFISPRALRIKPITKDTELYLSLSEHPGNTGTLLFNRLFSLCGIDAVYKACKVERGHFKDAFNGFKALKIAGGGVSMPFKYEAALMVYSLEGVAVRLGAINTLKADLSGKIKGYNTDYVAAHKVLPDFPMKTYVLGSGGVAAAVALALKDRGYHDVTIISRRPELIKIPQELNFKKIKWENLKDLEVPKAVFNCTPLGMVPENELITPVEWAAKLSLAVDLTYRPEGTLFANTLREKGVSVVDGKAFGRLQAVEQFRIYTGIRIDESSINE